MNVKILLISTALLSAVVSSSRINVKDKWMVDAHSRVRIFHGFNSVKKSYPWYDEQIFNETKLKLYQEWGFNAVRLGMMWKGYETEKNNYNETYIDTVQKAVTALKKHGLYSLLDAHQDVFSNADNVCPGSYCYEGIPNWVSNNFSSAFFKYPWPFLHISPDNWALGYLTLSVSNAFQQFYENKGGVMRQFGKFWKKVAEKLKDETGILGYELLNEPWIGNFFTEPNQILPGVAGKKLLLPMYDYLFKEIDKVDNHTTIFYEPITYSIFTNYKYFSTGFDRLPGGEEFENRAVLSYHYYCWPLQKQDMSSNYPYLLKGFCQKVIGSKVMPVMLESIEKTKGSLFLTEFGLCKPDGNPNSINTVECNFVLKQADDYLQSWTYWDSIFFLPDGQPNTHLLNR